MKVTVETKKEDTTFDFSKVIIIPVQEDPEIHTFGIQSLAEMVNAYNVLEDYIFRTVVAQNENLADKPKDIILKELKNLIREGLN